MRLRQHWLPDLPSSGQKRGGSLLADLPSVVALRALGHLDARSLGAVACTCKAMRELADDEAPWKVCWLRMRPPHGGLIRPPPG